MDEAVRTWLLAQLGPGTDAADLEVRYTRLRTARAVALEVLAERRAGLLAEPLRLTVDGVMTVDNSGNLTGLERQITAVSGAVAPDETTTGDEGLPVVVVAALRPARRRW
ncbi:MULTISPECIES: hypothetical protein [unclassified Streptomyces]|uniref:hypothetical protein n=1 Tax=unclassified Streptomyces TaxID=2593676 RepID=UPI0006ADE91F|nr:MULTISPECIES: hypothetical protein [unclassified Streptomyces]